MNHSKALEVVEALIDPCPFSTVSLSAMAELSHSERASVYEECVIVGGLHGV